MTGLDVAQKLMEYGVPAEHAWILAAVAYPESGYNPKAELKTAWEDSVGLFQINMYAHGDKLTRWTGSKDINVWREWLQNPENNIFAASQIYKSQGLGAWTVYQKGTYIPYLDKLAQLTVKPGGTAPASIPKDIQSSISKPKVNPAVIAGGAVILALVLAAGTALMVVGGTKNA